VLTVAMVSAWGQVIDIPHQPAMHLSLSTKWGLTQGRFPVAKKPGVNKTKAVAEYLKTNPKAKASEIADALTKKGVKISAGHAANIKSKLKLRRARRKQATVAGSATAADSVPAIPANAITFDQIKKVSQTVKEIGGFAKLKELLEVIREVGGLKRFKDLLAAMSAETDVIPF
jgi:hypothetical protein